MSMRGEIISGEYQKMVWVHDKNGKEYACYADDVKGNLKNKQDLSDEEKQHCLDLSHVVGESW